MNALLGEGISLIAGIATGFVFERRATSGIKESNEDLQRQISVLKTSVFSLSGKPAPKLPVDTEGDLATMVTSRAIATQRPDGRVDRSALIAYFVERDHQAREVDTVISSICRAGLAHEEGRWLQMT